MLQDRERDRHNKWRKITERERQSEWYGNKEREGERQTETQR